MLLHRRVKLDAPIGDGAHQIDAPARAVVFVAQLDVSRARGRTQAAMDAVEKQFVIDAGVVLGGRSVGKEVRVVSAVVVMEFEFQAACGLAFAHRPANAKPERR